MHPARSSIPRRRFRRVASVRTPLALRLAVVALAVGVSGCGDGSDGPSAAAPFAGMEVELLVPSGLDAAALWPRILDEWSARTGGSFRVVPYSLNSAQPDAAADGAPGNSAAGEQPRSPVIEAAGKARSNANGSSAILFFPLGELPDLAAAGILAPIPTAQRQADRLAWNDVPAGLRAGVGSVEGEAVAVPIAAPVLICYYRRDLLEKAGRKPPETWDEYHALLESLDEWAPGLTAVEPWGTEWRTTMFLARAVAYCRHPENYSVFFDVENAMPLINSPGFVRALDEARNTRIRLSPESLNYSPADCRREFFVGRAALAISFETGPGNPPPFGLSAAGNPAEGGAPDAANAGEGETTTARPAGMRAGFAPLPGVKQVYYRTSRGGRWEPPPSGSVQRVTLVGFSGLGAAVLGPDPSEAAWDLLRQLTIEDAVTAFPPGARTPCRLAQFDNPSVWVGPELTGTEPTEYLAAVEESLRSEIVVADLPIVARKRFRNALRIGLDAAITGRAPSAVALNTVAAGWATFLGEEDPRRVLDSYRRSLGLRPSLRE